MINNKITKKSRHVINLRSSIDSNIVLNFLINIVSTFECYQKRQSQRNTNNVHHIMLILTNFSRLNKHFICLPHIWYLFSKDKIAAVHYLLPKQWINNPSTYFLFILIAKVSIHIESRNWWSTISSITQN